MGEETASVAKNCCSDNVSEFVYSAVCLQWRDGAKMAETRIDESKMETSDVERGTTTNEIETRSDSLDILQKSATNRNSAPSP